MKKSKNFLFVILMIFLSVNSVGQKKYALLIGGPIDESHWDGEYNGGWFPEDYQDFFWSDVFLMHELLTKKFNYPEENVTVIFNRGSDYAPPPNPESYPIQYLPDYQIEPPLTSPGRSCIRSNVVEVLTSLQNTCTENDFVFIYVFTHGRDPESLPLLSVPYGILCPQTIRNDYLYTDNDYIFADEFTALVSGIKSKKVIWMQPCYSGGFSSYFNNYTNGYPFIVNYSSGPQESAWQADDQIYCVGSWTGWYSTPENDPPGYWSPGWQSAIHHGEFSYHLYSSLNGATPLNSQELDYMPLPIPYSNADNNPTDGIISAMENFTWANTYQSRQYANGGEHFSFQESAPGLSIKTSLKYPNIVNSINDLSATNTGIYGITADVIVNNNNSLTFGENSLIYLLNNAKIRVQDGSTLTLGNGVKIYGNEQNSINIEHGNINIGQQVSFIHLDSGHVFHGLYLSGYASCSQLEYPIFHRACLWNETENLSVDHGLFDTVSFNGEQGYGIFSAAGNVTLTHSTFNNSSIYLHNPGKHYYWQASVTNCQFSGGAINLVSYCNYIISYNVLTFPEDYAINLSYCGNGTSTNQEIRSNHISNSLTGLYLNNTSAEILNNNLHDNYRGFYFGNSSQISFFGGSTSITQQVKNCYTEELFIEKGCMPVLFHYNQIIDEDNIGGTLDPLIRYRTTPDDYSQYDLTHNCWGNNFNPNPNQDIYGQNVEFNTSAPWCPGDPIPEGPAIDMYSSALNEFDSGNYLVSKTIFKSIIDQFPNSVEAQASLKELFHLEEFADNDYLSLQQYYLSNDSILSDSSLVRLGRYFANRCNERFGNWEEEITWYENKILNPESETDSLFAILDLAQVYLLMQNSPSKASFVGTLSQYKPKSINLYARTHEDISSKIPMDQLKKQLLTRVHALSQGKLLQNIPNPVIDLTEIYFKIDNAEAIDIEILNTFGQVVKKQSYHDLQIGSNKVEMRLSELSPGLYFYALFSHGRQLDMKKLIKK